MIGKDPNDSEDFLGRVAPSDQAPIASLCERHRTRLRQMGSLWHLLERLPERRIVLVERPFAGYFQTIEYSYFEGRKGIPSLVPLTEVQVKAQIDRPARHEVVTRGRDYRVHGAVWAGESKVSKVEMSTDRGKHWAEATLIGEAIHHAWRLWEWKWRTPNEAGPGLIMARATDTRGRLQPMMRDVDRRTVMITHIVPVEFEVH